MQFIRSLIWEKLKFSSLHKFICENSKNWKVRELERVNIKFYDELDTFLATISAKKLSSTREFDFILNGKMKAIYSYKGSIFSWALEKFILWVRKRF